MYLFERELKGKTDEVYGLPLSHLLLKVIIACTINAWGEINE